MKIIFLFFVVLTIHVQCNFFYTDRKGGNHFPEKVNDTFWYVGSMSFVSANKNVDTTFTSTIFIVRTYIDSITLFYTKPYFLDLYDDITMQESSEIFNVSKKLEVHMNEKYVSYDFYLTYANMDSVSFNEKIIDKFINVRKDYSFFGKKIVSRARRVSFFRHSAASGCSS